MKKSFLVLIFAVLFIGCNNSNKKEVSSKDINLSSGYHSIYANVDSYASENLGEHFNNTYKRAISYSIEGNNEKALDNLETLLLEFDIYSDAKKFQIIDVRYQSIIRPTSNFKRADKIYATILNNHPDIDYLKAAYNFNQALLIKLNAYGSIKTLLDNANISESLNSNYVAFFNSVFVEGKQGYKSLESDKQIRAFETKYSNSESNIRSLNESNLESILQNYLSDPTSMELVSIILFNISSVEDIAYINSYLSNYLEHKNTKLLIDYLSIIKSNVEYYYSLYSDTKKLYTDNSNNQYIAITNSFLEYLLPFKNANNSIDTLSQYASQLDNNTSIKRSTNHHVNMLRSWSNSSSSVRGNVGECHCSIDLGIVSWSTTYKC